MSEIHDAIAAKWEADGLDATSDGMDTPSVEESAPIESDEPVVESEPVDDAAPVEDAPAEPDVDAPAVEETAPEAAVETVADAPKEEQDDLATALGLGKVPDDPKKRAAWWNTRVPYSKLHKIVTERNKAAQAKFDETLATHTAEIGGHKKYREEVGVVENFIKTNGREYLKTLMNIVPEQYGELLAPLFAGQYDAKAAASALPKADEPNPMPEPNVPLADGGSTYDINGLKSFAKWVQVETKKEMLKEFEPQLKFLSDSKKEQETKIAQTRRAEQSQKAINDAITEVASWEDGEANMAEIVAFSKTLPNHYDVLSALSIAYKNVVVPKQKKALQTSMEEMRKKVHEENKKLSVKKTAASVNPAIRTSVVTDGKKVKSDRDIIMEHAQRLKV